METNIIHVLLPPTVYIWVDIPFDFMTNFGGKSNINKMIYEVSLNYTMKHTQKCPL